MKTNNAKESSPCVMVYPRARDFLGYGLGMVSEYEVRERLGPNTALPSGSELSADDVNQMRDLVKQTFGFSNDPFEGLLGKSLQKYVHALCANPSRG